VSEPFVQVQNEVLRSAIYGPAGLVPEMAWQQSLANEKGRSNRIILPPMRTQVCYSRQRATVILEALKGTHSDDQGTKLGLIVRKGPKRGVCTK
jgi:hypothetical protein